MFLYGIYRNANQLRQDALYNAWQLNGASHERGRFIYMQY